ncbi:hypothetical protein HOY82DRAFT_600945 [Tuber indicum]|nr:hypothetical protein HOY82DRAFT_600945 [Tuber indicum]
MSKNSVRAIVRVDIYFVNSEALCAMLTIVTIRFQRYRRVPFFTGSAHLRYADCEGDTLFAPRENPVKLWHSAGVAHIAAGPRVVRTVDWTSKRFEVPYYGTAVEMACRLLFAGDQLGLS